MKTFLKDVHTDAIASVDTDKIVELNLYETYDDNGIELGHANAGDYSIYNPYCDLYDKLETALCNNLGGSQEDFIFFGDESLDSDSVTYFAKAFENRHSKYNKVEGFNYFDGMKMATVIIKDDNFGEITHEVITDKDLIEKIIEFRTPIYNY